jgi:hypothetical protein
MLSGKLRKAGAGVLKSSNSGRRWPLVFVALAALVIVVLASYSERYRFGQLLCRNFRDTWFEKSGYISCYRAP